MRVPYGVLPYHSIGMRCHPAPVPAPTRLQRVVHATIYCGAQYRTVRSPPYSCPGDLMGALAKRLRGGLVRSLPISHRRRMQKRQNAFLSPCPSFSRSATPSADDSPGPALIPQFTRQIPSISRIPPRRRPPSEPLRLALQQKRIAFPIHSSLHQPGSPLEATASPICQPSLPPITSHPASRRVRPACQPEAHATRRPTAR